MTASNTALKEKGTPTTLSDLIIQVLCSSVSVPELTQEKEEVLVYPNPTPGDVTIEISGNYKEVKVFDITGRQLVVPIQPTATRVRLDLSSYPPGLYVLDIQTERDLKREKVVKY